MNVSIDFPLLQALVKTIITEQVALHQFLLESNWRFNSVHWTVQGFGMMRFNLEKVGRIHIWDHRLRVPGMNSDIHTHPWDLRSTVISGQLFNGLFQESNDSEQPMYHRSLLQTGEGGKLLDLFPSLRYLKLISRNQYRAGEVYEQNSYQIHRTDFPDWEPTVTLLRRDKGASDERAYVYWPLCEKWMTAEPRQATLQEVVDVGRAALDKWG